MEMHVRVLGSIKDRGEFIEPFESLVYGQQVVQVPDTTQKVTRIQGNQQIVPVRMVTLFLVADPKGRFAWVTAEECELVKKEPQYATEECAAMFTPKREKLLYPVNHSPNSGLLFHRYSVRWIVSVNNRCFSDVMLFLAHEIERVVLGEFSLARDSGERSRVVEKIAKVTEGRRDRIGVHASVVPQGESVGDFHVMIEIPGKEEGFVTVYEAQI